MASRSLNGTLVATTTCSACTRAVAVEGGSNAGVTLANGARQPGEIFECVESRLSREAQRFAEARHGAGGCRHEFDIQAGAQRGVVFPGQQPGARIALAPYQVAVDAREAAIDAFFQADALDGVHRDTVAVRGHARAVFAVQVFEPEVAIVERLAQVARGARGLPGVEVVLLEHDHVHAGLRQSPGRGEARDPGANDAGAHVRVGNKGREDRRISRRHP